ncbi:pentatricopeptide repeat-containing protein At1g08070, chloroplastic-like [Zingiber officinale]|uniref:pentatricopeptide repeat-containing protein At1g08070, chloroplastic-like n=1 Tax=Zingiber officinale TaxID=94328 RepID=UPI001C4A7E6B|nr:pentatricopeptide repeat-containing protein At1g08070, chloroplastic-like [Zingiber officinale]
MSIPLASSSLPSKPPPHLSLQKCATVHELKQVHAQMIRSGLAFDPLPASHFVSVCCTPEFGCLEYARLVFRQIPNPSTFTFNSVARAYTNKNLPFQALLFYIESIERGLRPDRFTLPSLFKSCRFLNEGKQLHSHALKLGFSSDVYVQNTLMNMYSVCGCLRSACQVFDKMREKTIVSWATMIAAYTKSDRLFEAIDLYRRMELEPNEITLVNVLTACARARDIETGKQVHQYIEESGIGLDLVLSAALLDFYCKCGCVSLARKLFDEMPERNIFCWNIMIKGHVEDSDYKEALRLFREMQFIGIKADKVTMASMVLACSQLGALELGKWLHVYIAREKVEVDLVLGTALVDMYGRCGCVESAFKVFEDMPRRDVMTWTALIGGLAMCGHAERALRAFQEMQKSGVKPDAITFVGVLTACSHEGLVDEGWSYFNSMANGYNIQPSVEHYGCMVDMLGRAGQIERAEELIRGMPMAPDRFVLGGLLGACRIHGDVAVAERIARMLLELDQKEGGTYVLLSNIYRSLQKWDEANRVRKLMVERKVKKPPGCSLIEMDGEVHEFVMGDESHADSAEIYAMVEDMVGKLKEAGYVPNKSEVVLDMDEEEKESALCRHSEKLAMAFGLIRTRPGTPIRIMKNLRVCGDCHAAIKLVSKVYGREIVVRDRCRFHYFKDGCCSCKDYW